MKWATEKKAKVAGAEIFFSAGIALIFVGIIIIIVAVLLLSIRSAGKGKVRGGGAVIIGPIPIIFGTDRKSLKTVVLLSLALTVILVVVMVIYYWLLA